MICKKCNEEHNGSFGSGKYCSLSCANSRIFTQETKQKQGKASKGKTPWNKGVKLNWVKTNCEYCGLELLYRKSQPKKYHSECWLKSSGGYRKGSGIGKKGWYKGYWCDSTYELVWIIYQLEHFIPFERNKEKFFYKWENKIKFYIPDFIQNNQFIEIKGYMNKQVEEKIKSVPNLKILFKKDLEKEFQYVEEKYGKNFINLYE
jgi:hypothetical protein